MRSVGGAETKRNVLVDGNNLIHRAHHVFVESRLKEGKPALCSSGGFPTGVIYGFLSMLSSWLYNIHSPTSISVFFDGVPSRRLAIDPEYKSGRDARGVKVVSGGSDEQPVFTLRDGREIRGELELLIHILGLLGCDVYHHPSEEADDLIASFVNSKPGEVHIIVSSDKDFFQLVGDRVVLYRPGHGGFFDADRVMDHMEKVCGVRVPPAHIRMFKSLTGDPSDSIPGIPRLRKCLAAVLSSYPTVEALYGSGLPGLSKAEKERIETMKPRVVMNYDLVGLVSGLDIIACRHLGSLDLQAAKDICYDELGMKSLDFSSFRMGPRTSVQVPVDDWLHDI